MGKVNQERDLGSGTRKMIRFGEHQWTTPTEYKTELEKCGAITGFATVGTKQHGHAKGDIKGKVNHGG